MIDAKIAKALSKAIPSRPGFNQALYWRNDALALEVPISSDYRTICRGVLAGVSTCPVSAFITESNSLSVNLLRKVICVSRKFSHDGEAE